MTSARNFELFLENIMLQFDNPPICCSFIFQAIKTWNWLKSAKEIGLTLSEESITDFNLLELNLRHLEHIRTQKFTTIEEADTGADWEWWINFDDNWIGLRIQAKKLDSHSLKYKALHQKKSQIDDLINQALSSSPPLIPLYVFYNYTTNNEIIDEWKCKINSTCVLGNENWFGCGISHAYCVKDVLEKKKGKKFVDILEVSYPWSCLVCCNNSSYNNNDLPNKIHDFIKKGFGNIYNLNDIQEENFITKEPPSYVYNIIKREYISESDWNMIVKEKKISMITVISNRIEFMSDNNLSNIRRFQCR